MATAKSTPTPSATETPKRYVVVADAINVVTGKKPDGHTTSTRMVRGSILTAPESHPQVQEFLGMRGIVPEESRTEALKAIAAEGNVKRPFVQGRGEAGGTVARVTAAAVVQVLGAEDDPVLQPDPNILPVDAEYADLKPING